MGPLPVPALEVYQMMQKGKKKNKGKKSLAAGFQQVAEEVQKLSRKASKQVPSQVLEREAFVVVPKPSEKIRNGKQNKSSSVKGLALNGDRANGGDVDERSKTNSSALEAKRKVKRLRKEKEAKSLRPVEANSCSHSEEGVVNGAGKLRERKSQGLREIASKTDANPTIGSENSGQNSAERQPAQTSAKPEAEAEIANKKRRLKKAPPEKKPAPTRNENESIVADSRKAGTNMLKWVLIPVSVTDFLEKYWEERPLYIKRPLHRDYFKDVLSSADIDKALREHRMYFTKNVDVTSYLNGAKATHNPVGRAFAPVVWDFYQNGCSVRILNPQTYFPKVRRVCTTLQDCFNTFVGANVYLTPPNSQGFAPHYDDIEAFVLQLEGKKKWKVYPPMKDEKLPRTSSRNFTQEEMAEPILEVELQPGDTLYMPRGFIHQASTVPGVHSLHITISTYQHSSWADFMEKLVPAALANAIAEDDEFREGIPWDFLQHMGAVYSTDTTDQRKMFSDKIKGLFSKLFGHAPVDAAADQLAREYLHESLPPMLSTSERSLSVHGDGETLKNGKVSPPRQLSLDCSIRLTRHGVLRLVSEENPETVSLYHCAENPLVYKEEEEKLVEVAVELAPAVEALIRNYPAYTRVADLPLDDEELKVAVELWERGLVTTKERIPYSEATIIED